MSHLRVPDMPGATGVQFYKSDVCFIQIIQETGQKNKFLNQDGQKSRPAV